MIIIAILAIYGLLFLISQTDGPFGIIGNCRNALMRNHYLGTFFFKLLECAFCLGCHCGWIIYLLMTPTLRFGDFVVWTLAGGTIGLIINTALNKLNEIK